MAWKLNLDENYVNINRQPSPDEYAKAAESENIQLNYGKLLEGKVAIITGASYGMGYAMAELYARHGARIIMIARTKAKLVVAADQIRAAVTGADLLPVASDVCNREATQKLFSDVKEKYGRLDILVNNAGMGDQWRPEEVPDDVMDYIVDLNLKGPIRYCREALKIMLPQNYGRIINVSSVNGIRSMCGSTYGSTKGGLNQLSKAIAIRCVGTGVTCNSLCPGFTVTPMSLDQEKGGDDGLAPAGKDMVPILHTRTVRNVPTFPIDQANLALFLGSDMSRAITGQWIVCDNGQYL